MYEVKQEEKNIPEKEDIGKKGISFRFEIALFLILGFLLGVVIKTEALKKITIGYNDSEIVSVKQGYDFKKIEEELTKESESQDQQNSSDQGGQEGINSGN